MSHLDEGTLHALLDGELDLHEVKEIQAHIGSCAACGTRLREVKEFHGESDRLVGLLEVPAAPSRWTAVPTDAEPDPVQQPPERPAPPRSPRNLSRTSGPVAEPPPLLLPDSSEYGRGRFMRRMRWAALVLVIVGAGYLGNHMRQSGNVEFDGLPLSGTTADSVSGAVLSTEEAAPPAGSNTAAAEASGGGPAAEKRSSTAQQKSAAGVPKRVAPRAETPAASPARERSRAPAPVQTATEEPESSLAVGTVGGAGNAEDSADEAAEDQPTERQSDVRAEAARALRELDRERQMDRADAATAALDSARRREAMVRQAAATAAPAPRTPEQRARTYLRIGLDEASKQLGGPVHVIEGMSPLFMGLALGKTSPGADATGSAGGLSGFPGPADPARPAAAAARSGHQRAGTRAALDRGRDRAPYERRGESRHSQKPAGARQVAAGAPRSSTSRTTCIRPSEVKGLWRKLVSVPCTPRRNTSSLV
jgi:anti-sigma factor RsiW